MSAQQKKVVDLQEFDNDQKIIFREIAEFRRVNYYQLEAALRADNGHGQMTRENIKKVIRERIARLKRLQWVGELTSTNEELSVFYITADGSIVADKAF